MYIDILQEKELYFAQEFNIAPQKLSSQKESGLPAIFLQGLCYCKVHGRICKIQIWCERQNQDLMASRDGRQCTF